MSCPRRMKRNWKSRAGKLGCLICYSGPVQCCRDHRTTLDGKAKEVRDNFLAEQQTGKDEQNKP